MRKNIVAIALLLSCSALFKLPVTFADVESDAVRLKKYNVSEKFNRDRVEYERSKLGIKLLLDVRDANQAKNIEQLEKTGENIKNAFLKKLINQEEYMHLMVLLCRLINNSITSGDYDTTRLECGYDVLNKQAKSALDLCENVLESVEVNLLRYLSNDLWYSPLRK